MLCVPAQAFLSAFTATLNLQLLMSLFDCIEHVNYTLCTDSYRLPILCFDYLPANYTANSINPYAAVFDNNQRLYWVFGGGGHFEWMLNCCLCHQRLLCMCTLLCMHMYKCDCVNILCMFKSVAHLTWSGCYLVHPPFSDGQLKFSYCSKSL